MHPRYTKLERLYERARERLQSCYVGWYNEHNNIPEGYITDYEWTYVAVYACATIERLLRPCLKHRTDEIRAYIRACIKEALERHKEQAMALKELLGGGARYHWCDFYVITP
jgi:hypothetical protein